MPTLGQLKAQIADELARNDLSSQIQIAINDAIKSYELERLWFNTSRNISFATIADQINYDATAHTLIPRLLHIDAVKMLDGSKVRYDLDQHYAQDFDDLGDATGRPTTYTYTPNDPGGDMELRLWPTPNAVYPIRVYATYRLPPFANDDDSNAWINEAGELIRTAAKLRIYFHVTQDPENAALMRVGTEALLNNLRAETSLRRGRGVIQPTEF